MPAQTRPPNGPGTIGLNATGRLERRTKFCRRPFPPGASERQNISPACWETVKGGPPLARILVEKFHADVLEWLRVRAEVIVVDPWVDPDLWENEAPQVDAVISRKGRITRE